MAFLRYGALAIALGFGWDGWLAYMDFGIRSFLDANWESYHICIRIRSLLKLDRHFCGFRPSVEETALHWGMMNTLPVHASRYGNADENTMTVLLIS
jgi:hypothetical protein